MSAPTMTPHTYRCDRCIWADPLIAVYDRLTHRCRKATPQIVPERSGLRGEWPLVMADDYCGHFTPRRDDEREPAR